MMLYYKEKPINIGDLINIDDVKIVLTQEIVDNNPSLFIELGYVKLLEDWSIGDEYLGEIFELSTLNNLDKFESAPTKEDFRKNIFFWINGGFFKIATKEDFDKQELTREAIKRGFDKCPKWLIYPWQKEQKPQNPSWNVNKEFYFTENVKDSFLHKGVIIYKSGVWAKILKENVKSLEYYEDILLLNDNLADTDLENDVWEMYAWLKRNEPKLYWSKILQLIADDLNEEINLKQRPRATYNINFDKSFQKYVTGSWYDINSGYVQFKSEELAKQAINLMGSKLDYIYK